jgi:tetratricopeptide (TPR) repeat protein
LTFWPRWAATAAGALAAFGGCWWGLQAGAGLNAGLAVAVSVVPFTAALALGGAWANDQSNGRTAVHIGPSVSESPSGQAIGVAQGPVFGPGSVFTGASIVFGDTVDRGGPRAEPRKRGQERAVVGDIPQEPVAFLDRPELLRELLDPPPGRRAAPVFAVIGIRGVGKSQLAAACARRRLDEGWRVVAWLNAEDRGQLLAGFEQLAGAVGLTDDGQDPQQSAVRVRHWLEADGRQCLLVLDNAADANVVRPFLPAAGSAQVIVTSTRQALASLGVPVPVDVFTPQQAAQFLGRRTRQTDESGAAALAEELGYLPLALAQAAAVIAGQRLEYSTYLQRLAAVPAAGYLASTEEDPYARSAVEAITLSLAATEGSDPTGLCRLLLEVTSILSPAGVSRTLLAAAAGAPDAAIDRSLQMLADASLMTWSVDGTAVAVHRLVTRVVRDRASRDGTLLTVADRAISALHAAQVPIEQAWQHVAQAQNLVQQITALAGHLARYPDVLTGQRGINLLALRASAGLFFNQMKDSSHAIPVWQQVACDSERLLGPDHPDTLSASVNLALAYQKAGRLGEAIGLFEPSLADSERILGPDHPATLRTRVNLARAYQEAGRLDEAIPLHEQALAGNNRIHGPDHPDTLYSRGHLARAYYQAGRLDEAIPLHEQAVGDSVRVLGPDHPRSLSSRNDLARTYQAAGRLDDAVRLVEQNFADRVRVLGPDHPDTMNSRGNVALAYQAAGRTGEAIALHEQNLADRTRVLGANRPDTLNSRHNLARAYQAAGRVEEAIPLFELNLADRLRVLSSDHPDTLTSRADLARAYQAAGRVDAAVPLFEQALSDCERLLGPDHPTTRNVLNDLRQARSAPQ